MNSIKLILITFFSFTLLISACKKDDDNPYIDPNDKIFTSQENVWQPTYDELSAFSDSSYNVIVGDVTISGLGKLYDLSFLSNVHSIHGIVRIYDNKNLASLSGLNNLITIGGLYIGRLAPYYHLKIENLNGLENLQTIIGCLVLYENTELTNISALSNLHKIGQSVFIVDNFVLSSLNGLESVESIPNELVIGGNDSLSDFCSIKEILKNRSPNYTDIRNNLLNPSIEDIIAGNCSQ